MQCAWLFTAASPRGSGMWMVAPLTLTATQLVTRAAVARMADVPESVVARASVKAAALEATIARRALPPSPAEASGVPMDDADAATYGRLAAERLAALREALAAGDDAGLLELCRSQQTLLQAELHARAAGV
jgi:hypothetical protein